MSSITNIVLIGLPGVGKTTVGKILATKLKLEFIDLDRCIEQRCGVDIATIFAIEGEKGFRERETFELKDVLSKKQKFVLSTGGGAILATENRRLISHQFVIELSADVDTLLHRLQKGINTRPILSSNNLIGKIMQLKLERQVIYESLSDLKIDTSNCHAKHVVNLIVDYINHL